MIESEKKIKISKKLIPQEILKVIQKLLKNNFEAYLVGGCVRDLIMNRKPKDWDITTNALPEEIVKIFPDSIYNNTFGTVLVKLSQENENNKIKDVEVTPYREELGYSDFRHPDKVIFGKDLKTDLSRRDFTINALALDVNDEKIIDYFNGLEDIKNKIIRTVGNPKERFSEDALRLMRAIRFSVELDFKIDSQTEKAILEKSFLIKKISIERVRDEFEKIILSQNPERGILLIYKLGLLKFLIPELEKEIGCEQKGEHKYDVWTHSLKSLQHAANKNYPLTIRLAALFHDIAKPLTKKKGEKKEFTFYGHEILGAYITKKILQRLKFPNKIIEQVYKLVRFHMFFSDPDKITLSGARRLLRKVGQELVWDLIKLRICDRIGMGRPKEEPYRLRKFQAMIEEALRAPISLKMLKIDGNKIMEITGEKPGPRIGWILHVLFEETLSYPEKNNLEYLSQRAIELSKLADEDLKKIGEKGKEKFIEEKEKEVKEIRKKYKVS